MTIVEFAEQLGVSTRAVDKWEARGVGIEPRPELQRALDTALSRADPSVHDRMASPDVLGGPKYVDVPPPGMAATPTTEILRWLVEDSPSSPRPRARHGRVTDEDVAGVAAAVRRFEDLDHRFGGGYARATAAEYLVSNVRPLIALGGPNSVHDQLMSAAAELTYKIGAMAYDCGSHDIARRYFRNAFDLTRAGDDRALGGKVLAVMSHQANFLGHHADAVDLARAAKLGARGAASPRVHAMYCAMEARALAAGGDEASATRAIMEAEVAYAKHDGEPGPPWIRYFDFSELHDEFGHCFRDLNRPLEAALHLSVALDSSSAAYPRSRTFSRLVLASTHLQQGDVDTAASSAVDAITSLGSLQSARVRSYIRDLKARFIPFAGSAAVAEFTRRTRTLPAT